MPSKKGGGKRSAKAMESDTADGDGREKEDDPVIKVARVYCMLIC
jgi:hypothetical protein